MENYFKATFKRPHSTLHGKRIVVKGRVREEVEGHSRSGRKKTEVIYYYMGWFLNDLINNDFEFTEGIVFSESEVSF